MSKLDDLLHSHHREWTDDELADWINSLPEHQRNSLLDEAAACKDNGGDVSLFVTHMRRMHEANGQSSNMPWYEVVSALTTGWFLGGLKRGIVPHQDNDGVYVGKLF